MRKEFSCLPQSLFLPIALFLAFLLIYNIYLVIIDIWICPSGTSPLPCLWPSFLLFCCFPLWWMLSQVTSFFQRLPLFFLLYLFLVLIAFSQNWLYTQLSSFTQQIFREQSHKSGTLPSTGTLVVSDCSWPTCVWDVFLVSFDHITVKVLRLHL